MLNTVYCLKHQQWTREHQNWTTEQCEKVIWSGESCFLLPHVDGHVRVHHLPGNTWQHDALWEEGKLLEKV